MNGLTIAKIFVMTALIDAQGPEGSMNGTMQNNENPTFPYNASTPYLVSEITQK